MSTLDEAAVAEAIQLVNQRIAEEKESDPPAIPLTIETEWIRQLHAARIAQGLSQVRTAERMGTNQSSVSDLEKGVVNPGMLTLARYGAAVGYQMNVTFTRIDGDHPTALDPQVMAWRLYTGEEYGGIYCAEPGCGCEAHNSEILHGAWPRENDGDDLETCSLVELHKRIAEHIEHRAEVRAEQEGNE